MDCRLKPTVHFMPNYDYKCNLCNEVFEEFHKIADREIPFTKPCPKCGQENCVIMAYLSTPAICDPVNIGVKKPDKGFKEVMDKIKSKHKKHTMKDRFF